MKKHMTAALLGVAALTSTVSALAETVYNWSFDSQGGWGLGGAQAANTVLSIDETFKTEGAGSLRAEVTYASSSFAYIDIYNDNLTGAPLDFSAGPISFDFSSSNIGGKLIVRLGTVADGVKETVVNVNAENIWQSFALDPAVFGAPSSISAVNLVQFRFIGDDVASFPSTVVYHIDNFVVGTAAAIPEPASYAVLIGMAAATVISARRRPKVAGLEAL